MVSSSGKRRRNLAKAQHKKEIKRAVKKESQFVKILPKISENDLLAFQLAHFGDDSRPEKWFVMPEVAINFEPEYEDVLGYYDDGVKRTLTDEQIDVFRRTEMWNLEREQKRLAEDAVEGSSGVEQTTTVQQGGAQDLMTAAPSPPSEASSLEDDLISQAVRNKLHLPQLTRLPPREPSQSSRSDATISTDGSKRRRSQEVPYDERRKRHWESYIEDHDPIEGSLTHRRMARELDDQKEESFEMDY